MKAGGTAEQRVVVDASQLAGGDCWVAWEFSTAVKDIGFAVRFVPEGSEDGAAETIMPLRRYDSHKFEVRGCTRAYCPGTFVLMHDNTHSRWKSKTLTAHAHVVQCAPQ